ncbi:MAG: NIPSNAP family protein [Vicinamibacterales bacterium]
MHRLVTSSLTAVAIVAGSIGIGAQAGQPAAAPRPPQPSPACGAGQPTTSKSVDKASRCFELRTYTVREGSSIELLHSRFREHTSSLFRKHGMTIVGYWQPVEKPNTLIYILAYKDNGGA